MLANQGQNNPFGSVGAQPDMSQSDRDALKQLAKLDKNDPNFERNARAILDEQADNELAFIDTLDVTPLVKSRVRMLVTQCRTIESHIELYRVENRGQFPNLLADGWQPLVRMGYMKQSPINPFAIPAPRAATIGHNPVAGVGWYYDKERGTCRAIVEHALAVRLRLAPKNSRPGSVHDYVVTY